MSASNSDSIVNFVVAELFFGGIPRREGKLTDARLIGPRAVIVQLASDCNWVKRFDWVVGA